jgi:DNA-binding beta-propeller fold protein YncE
MSARAGLNTDGVLRAILAGAWLSGAAAPCLAGGEAAPPAERRLLYVASPGIRNYVEWGGKGILVYDIAGGHAFVKRIPSPFDDPGGKVENIKGICASVTNRRLYVTSLTRLACIDLVTEKLLWVEALEGGCDRMAITPDGKALYVPSLEGPHWNVVDGITGAVVRKLTIGQGAHNTVCPPSGTRVFMADLKSPHLLVADPATQQVVQQVGPFSAPIRPFTVNGDGTLSFVNVNGLLGFEVGDVGAGTMLHRVEVPGFRPGPVKRHGCPSHGVGLTPDEKELWLVDGANQRLHVFDATAMPPRYRESIELFVDQPGWITFSLDGRHAYPSTGEVIDTRTRKIVAHLKDEQGRQVQSEKLLEIDFAQGVPVRAGDQFGVGRVVR